MYYYTKNLKLKACLQYLQKYIKLSFQGQMDHSENEVNDTDENMTENIPKPNILQVLKL